MRSIISLCVRFLNYVSISIKSVSLFSLCPHLIYSKPSSVGLELGNSQSHVRVSTNVLRHMEFDCLTVIPKVSAGLSSTYDDEDEAIAT